MEMQVQRQNEEVDIRLEGSKSEDNRAAGDDNYQW